MTASTPSIRPVREVRFAVVMYGGVSLAIYIHGVARELWHLVRATARRPDGHPLIPVGKLTGSERVYRKLSHSLPEHGDGPSSVADAATLEGRLTDAGPVRFVVDLISGTSAGGINGVFLAKALAANQDLSPLRDLWLADGDLSTLLNDTRSVEGMRDLALGNPPESLLNSGRMYRLLLKALSSMKLKDDTPADAPSNFVDQLDLFVTATDIRGLILPIELADMQVDERRHRTVFQFIYAPLDPAMPRVAHPEVPVGRNDFESRHTPYLAFAARCTSAFPFAFEPMQLADIDAHLAQAPDDATRAHWKRYFHRDYDGDPEVADFKARSFGDGGYLDNKPFSYVTDALRIRRAEVPVDRKLIYVEPSPEHPCEDGVSRKTQRPDAIENVLAAAFTLPAKETVRDDIRRLTQRNDLLERMRRITENIEADLVADIDATGRTGESFAEARKKRKALNAAEWARLDLVDIVRRHGMSFLAYHRLKIADTTDDLSEVISGLALVATESKAFVALRLLVQVWRDATYIDKRDAEKDDRPTQNQFLLDFNFRYRYRRMLFLKGRLDQLARMDARADMIMRCGGVPFQLSTVARDDHLREIDHLRNEVNRLYAGLRHERRVLRRGVAREAVEAIKELNVQPAALLELVAPPDDTSRERRARAFFDKHRPVIDKVMKVLTDRMREIFVFNSGECVKRLKPQPADTAHLARLKQVLWYYFENFEDYDQYLYPLMYGSDAEESDPVEILRVSPEDARRLVDERPPGASENACQKLGGTFLGNFGGFLDPLWRHNDMLWGRLDGIERLLRALLPHEENATLRERLVAEAQAAVVHEEIEGLPDHDARRLLVEGLMRTARQKPDFAALGRFRKALVEDAPAGPIRTRLAQVLEPVAMRACYEAAFVDDRRPLPEPSLQTAARAATITGKLLDGLAERRPFLTRPGAWFTRIGSIATGLVNLALPRSYGEILWRHWVDLLLLCAVIVFAIGALLGKIEVMGYGVALFAIGLCARAVLTFLNRLMRLGWKECGLWFGILRGLWKGVLILALAGVVGLAVLGVRYIGSTDEGVWPRVRGWFGSSAAEPADPGS